MRMPRLPRQRHDDDVVRNRREALLYKLTKLRRDRAFYLEEILTRNYTTQVEYEDILRQFNRKDQKVRELEQQFERLNVHEGTRVENIIHPDREVFLDQQHTINAQLEPGRRIGINYFDWLVNHNNQQNQQQQ